MRDDTFWEKSWTVLLDEEAFVLLMLLMLE